MFNKQKLPFGYKMNLFKELPTSNEEKFNSEGFEENYDYIDPVELLGTRNEEFGEEKYKKFVLNSLNEGVTLVGGCCEVKPRHIEAIKNLF